MRAGSQQSRRVVSLDRYLAEPLEQRLLLASLLDLVGRTSPPAVQMPVDSESNLQAASGAQSGTVQIAASDSEWDTLWLANHVNAAALRALDKTDGALQDMYAQWLRDGKDLNTLTVHNTHPADIYVTSGDTVMVELGSPNASALATKVGNLGFRVNTQYDGASGGIVD